MCSEFEEMLYKIIMNLQLNPSYTHITSISLEFGGFVLLFSIFFFYFSNASVLDLKKLDFC